jgi:hypothetical protein
MKRTRSGDANKAARNRNRNAPEDTPSTVDADASAALIVTSTTASSSHDPATGTVKKASTTSSSKEEGSQQQGQQEDTKEDDTTILVTLTPHTVRLLKLIREGTAEHAAQASLHLTALMRTASPLQLWDVLGRLQGFLTAMDWRTRQHAANALQGVARHLPVMDQEHFLESSKRQQQDDNNSIAGTGTTVTNISHNKSYYLEVHDLVTSMDVVLREGRLLLATSDLKYTYDRDEEQRLQELDQSAAADEDFVERRIQLQRHILAQRLGLAGLGRVVGDGYLMPDVITSEDMIPAPSASASALSSSPTDKPKAKRQKHAERIRKRLLKQQDNDDGTDNSTEHSVRALLVMKMEEERKNSSTAGAASHRTPQTLLATELIYRMFDASWHVRHGALLGTLSLLRAWRTNVASTHFGVWPQDILARCLCVLALDRFGDFSGALTPVSVSGTTTGGVVAPVRETAGQLLSVLFTMAPQELQKTTLELLFRLARYPSEWEARHGALVALKFVTVILTTTTGAVLQQRPETTTEWNRKVIQDISRAAINHLADDSDDVKSVAAQIILEFVRASPVLPLFVWDASKPLWVALQKIKSVSSCIVDLVTLLSLFLRRYCDETLRAISIVHDETKADTDGDTETCGDILQALVRLLDSDFLSVHNSALQSIGVVVEPLSRSLPEQGPDDEATTSTMSTPVIVSFCGVVNRLYDLYFNTETLDEGNSATDEATENSQRALRDETWSSIVRTAPRFLRNTVKDRRALELDLICRYFAIKSDRTSGGHFSCSTQAAAALARFLCASSNPVDDSPILEFALGSYLQSPWSSQCEAACILYREVAAHYSRRGIPALQDLRLALIESLQTPFLCLDAEKDSEMSNIIKSASVATACDRAFLEGVSRIENGTNEVAEASRIVVGVWKESIRAEGLNMDSDKRTSTTVASMRIDAAASGAVLAGGLPSKITPIVRALMTSLKNEASASRRNETCKYFAELLRLIKDDPTSTHSKAWTKVLSSLCNMIAGGSNTSGPTFGVSAAINVVRSVVSTMPDDLTLEDLPPLWSVLAPVCSFEPASVGDRVFTRSVNLLRAVCGGLSRAKPLTFHIVDAVVPNLVFLACQQDDIDDQKLYSSTIKELCSVNPTRVLGPALSALTAYLNDRERDAQRLAACQLLESLLKDSAMEICPFVRYLLPRVMSLMTDPLKDCSQIANSIFASLVRFAPLVQEGSSLMIGKGKLDRDSESVVDHLILGRPLPPCTLPIAVSAALKEGGVTLRQYQIEGVAWLRFLQTVKLNGALCDSMGLGKTLQALVGVAMAHHDNLGIGEKHEHASLIVCPSTVVGHWVAEIEKFFPGQSIFRSLYFAGSASERKSLWSSTMPRCNIIVTSYSVLRSDVDLLASKEWCFCILDEGHLLKNPKTGETRA